MIRTEHADQMAEMLDLYVVDCCLVSVNKVAEIGYDDKLGPAENETYNDRMYKRHQKRGAYPVELFMILLDSSGRYLNDSINRTIVSSLFLDFVLDANYRVTFSMQTFDMHR